MKVISFDGGGLRGVMSARIAERLATQFPQFWQEAGLLAGTSTGSILAAGLAMGLNPSQLVNFYKQQAPAIFTDPFWHKLSSLDEVVGAKYPADSKKKVFQNIFGNKKLGDLKQQVLLVSFELDNQGKDKYGQSVPRQWWPRVFDNAPGSPDCDILVVDALMASTAAPTYWPIYNGFVDGGIKYNNPTMLALIEAIRRGSKLEDLSLLSLGTGLDPSFLTEKNANWGLAEWAPVLLNILLSDDAAVNVEASSLLKESFLRLQPIINQNISLDDTHSLDTLMNYANQFDLTAAQAWFTNIYQRKVRSAA